MEKRKGEEQQAEEPETTRRGNEATSASTPRAVTPVVLPDSPTVQEAREFWASLGPWAEAQAKKARLAAVAVNKPNTKFETEDDKEEETVVENLVRDENVEEYWEHDEELEEERVNGNWWKEIDKLVEFEAFEVVPADKAAGHLVLNTRFVDTKGKSRFVAKEIRTYATDEFYAPASTSATGRLVDILGDQEAAEQIGSRCWTGLSACAGG